MLNNCINHINTYLLKTTVNTEKNGFCPNFFAPETGLRVYINYRHSILLQFKSDLGNGCPGRLGLFRLANRDHSVFLEPLYMLRPLGGIG